MWWFSREYIFWITICLQILSIKSLGRRTFSHGALSNKKAFKQVKQEKVHAKVLGPVQTGQDVKNVLCTAARVTGPTWSLWQKPGETRDQLLGFWNQGQRESKAWYISTEKERMKGFRQLWKWLVPKRNSFLHPDCLFWAECSKRESPPCIMHLSKWVALITQLARIGNPCCLGILGVIMNWPEGKDFAISPEEEVTCTDETPLYDKMSENEMCPIC